MINTIDHLIVAVSDISIAEKNYSKIFGSEPVWRGEHAEYGTENSLFNFNNTYFELLAAKVMVGAIQSCSSETGEGLIGIVFGTDNLKASNTFRKGLGRYFRWRGANFKDNKTRKWKNLFYHQS